MPMPSLSPSRLFCHIHSIRLYRLSPSHPPHPASHRTPSSSPIPESHVAYIIHRLHHRSTRLKLHHTNCTQSVPLIPSPQEIFHSPIRPLLVQHTMSAVPAPNGLAALQRHVLVAVAALVVDGARRGVDGGGVGGGLGGVGLGGHFGGLSGRECGVWFGGGGVAGWRVEWEVGVCAWALVAVLGGKKSWGTCAVGLGLSIRRGLHRLFGMRRVTCGLLDG